MSDEEQPIGVGLIQNLGTDKRKMGFGLIDDMKFSVIDDDELMFVLIADFMGTHDPHMKRILNTFLVAKISVDGRGRRDAIRGESVMKGGPSGIESEIQRPGWLGRNVLNRDWEKDERRRLGIEEEPKT